MTINVNRKTMAWISVICLLGGLACAGMGTFGYIAASSSDVSMSQVRFAMELSSAFGVKPDLNLGEQLMLFCCMNSQSLLIGGGIAVLAGLLMPKGKDPEAA